MKRVVFVTCGTSLLRSGCWTKPAVSSIPSEEREKQLVLRQNEDSIREYMLHNRPDEFVISQGVLQALDSRLGDLPAEIPSLLVLDSLLRKGHSKGLGADDEVLLLHSSDEWGSNCALVIQHVLQNHLLVGPNVGHEAFPGLDPQEPEGFVDGVKCMWNYCSRMIVDSETETRFYFSLTGGYKPMGFTLGALCYKYHNYSIDIIYRHETSGSTLVKMRFDTGDPAPSLLVEETAPVRIHRSHADREL